MGLRSFGGDSPFSVILAPSLSQVTCFFLILLLSAIREGPPNAWQREEMHGGRPGACMKWDVTQRSGSCHTLKAKLSSFALSHSLGCQTHTLGQECLYIVLGL